MLYCIEGFIYCFPNNQSSSCPDGEVDRHPQKQHDSGKNEVCVSEKAAQQQCHVHDHQGLQVSFCLIVIPMGESR